MEHLAFVLNLVMEPCHRLTGNWWLAILLFTVIIKAVLLPLSLWCQKNSIVMVQLMPAVNRIKVEHYGDREAIGDKQSELYKERRYHPLASLIPLAVQILILFGLVDVIHGITDHGAPGTELLGLVPISDGGLAWLMVLAAGLSAVVMGFAQNRINPLQREQSRAEKNMTNGLSIALSFGLAVFVATGMGFYWVCSNLTSVGIQALCNLIIKPRKHIDYAELEASRVQLAELEALGGPKRKWWQRDPLAKREKADYKRFFSVANKHIVFYAESSGFYKYFQGYVEYLLEHSDAVVHYVTNDPNDRIFTLAEQVGGGRIRPYYIGPKRIITLMMKMDADIVVTTQEDLDNYYIKRSYVNKNTLYVFTFHHMTSTHMTALKESYFNFDVIMCVGPHQMRELRRAEELYGVRKKELVEAGYALLDRTRASYRELVERRAAENPGHGYGANPAEDPGYGRRDRALSCPPDPDTAADAPRPTVIVAPSWQQGCIPDSCIDEVIDRLSGRGWRIVVRAHPEYIKRFRPRWDAILARYAGRPESELFFESDFSSNESVFSADVLITDWSTVAHEYSFATCKPSIFIDTPVKMGNPDYEELGIPATDLTLRDEIGVSLPLEDLSGLADAVEEMLANPDAWHDRIAEVTRRHVYHLDHSAEVAGEWLLTRLLERQEQAKEAIA